jgi:uncharacterized protein
VLGQAAGLMPIYEYCISINLLCVWKGEAYAIYGLKLDENPERGAYVLMAETQSATTERTPIRDGLLTGALSNLDEVRLLGSRCSQCGETSLGRAKVCANCGQATITEIPLSNHGVLWTFTVVRHRPPGDYKGPDPFVPFGMGLVELPEGLRVLSPIQCDVAQLKIGLQLRFKPVVRKESDGREIVSFTFESADDGRRFGSNE